MTGTALMRRTPTFVIVLAGMVGLALYYALVTHFAFAAGARRVLGVHFVAVPDRPGEALSIWLHNSRVTIGVAVYSAIAQIVQCLPVDGPAGAERIPLWIGDAILGLWGVGTVAVAGVLIGAYGAVQLHAFWPDGPVELTAWSLLLALVMDARRRRLGWRDTAARVATVELLLALAAILEVGGLAL
jgi:hypothetical protein